MDAALAQLGDDVLRGVGVLHQHALGQFDDQYFRRYAGTLQLLVDELDQAFANVYSSTVSVHNLAPRLDRRVIWVAVGVVATVLAGLAGFDQYEGFLYLIGSAFVPLFTVAVVDFFVTRRGRWDTTATAPFRWSPTLAWFFGFVAYQLIYPGSIPGWSDLWAGLAQALGFVAPGWLGSTLGSIVVSAVAAAGLGAIDTAVHRRRAEGRLA